MTLTFVTPTLLAGALFVAVPIVLHLVMRQKPRQLEFPPLRLVQRRQRADKRRLRLRHFLLLLLRCAAILLLAAALARPTLLPPGATRLEPGPLAVALVFDNSPRMGYRERNATSLDRAKAIALRLLEELPAESEIWILESRPPLTTAPQYPPMARDQVDRLGLENELMPLAQRITDALARLAQSNAGRRELYVFSDLAQSAWESVHGFSWREQFDAAPQTSLFVVDVGTEEPRNLALGDVALSSQRAITTAPIAISTSLLVRGRPDTNAVTAELYLGKEGKLEKRAQHTVAISADASTEIPLPPLEGLDAGVHQGEIRLQASDGLSIDNTRYFTLDVAAPPQLLLAAPEPVGRYADIFAQALAPESLRRHRAARFNPTAVPIAALETAELDTVAAVVLLDPTPPTPRAWQRLREYVAQGGGLALLLGRNATTEGFTAAAAQDLLPGTLRRVWRAGERPSFLVLDNVDHPLLADFRDLEGSVPWSALPILRYWQFDEILPAGIHVVARFAQGDPAIMVHAFHRGKVVTLATPLSDAPSDEEPWNTLITSWPGFLLANALADYLSGAREIRWNYAPGEVVSLAVGEERAAEGLVLFRPDGQEERLVSPAPAGLVTLPPGTMPGNYRLRGGGAEGGLALGFSVNLPPSATDVRRISRQDLEALLPAERLRVVRGLPELDRTLTASRGGRDLYPWIMVLAALVVLAEGILANRFYRPAPLAALHPGPSTPRGLVRNHADQAAVGG